MHSWSTDLLFCLEFVEITNKRETVGDLKARERKGMAVGKDKYILFLRPLCVHSRAPRTLCLRARRKITCVDRIGSEQKKSGIGFLLSMPTNKICTITIRFVARALISF